MDKFLGGALIEVSYLIDFCEKEKITEVVFKRKIGNALNKIVLRFLPCIIKYDFRIPLSSLYILKDFLERQLRRKNFKFCSFRTTPRHLIITTLEYTDTQLVETPIKIRVRINLWQWLMKKKF